MGITPAGPGFAEVSIAPRIHDVFGPRTVRGEFLSAKGRIVVSWAQHTGNCTVTTRVKLPIGVARATVIVPKPMANGKAVATAVVRLHGQVIWDGAKLISAPAGIESAIDQPGGVAFAVTNGVFAFQSVAGQACSWPGSSATGMSAGSPPPPRA